MSGAFMALLGSTFLDEIVAVKNIHQPVNILTELHHKVTNKLHQGPKLDSDGLELALCRFENVNNNEVKMTFAGARSNVHYILPNSTQLYTLSGERKGIGGIFQRASKEFSEQELTLPKGTTLYFFTDGLTDYPTPKGRRLGTRKVLRFIERHAKLDIHQQTEMIEKILGRYKLKIKQRDDISFIVLKL